MVWGFGFRDCLEGQGSCPKVLTPISHVITLVIPLLAWNDEVEAGITLCLVVYRDTWGSGDLASIL